jgi:hypothetical protein
LKIIGTVAGHSSLLIVKANQNGASDKSKKKKNLILQQQHIDFNTKCTAVA